MAGAAPAAVDAARRELRALTLPGIYVPMWGLGDSNDLRVTQAGGGLLLFLPSLAGSLALEGSGGRLSQRNFSSGVNSFTLRLSQLFPTPELKIDLAVGLNQYDRATDVTWQAGGLYYLGEAVTIGAEVSREALLAVNSRRELRQFSRVLDVETIGPGFHSDVFRGLLEFATPINRRTRLDTGFERFQDGNRRTYVYLHYQVPTESSARAWTAIRPNVFFETFRDNRSPYFSPQRHVTIGSMLHTIRRFAGWEIESEINPQLLYTDGATGLGGHGLMNVGAQSWNDIADWRRVYLLGRSREAPAMAGRRTGQRPDRPLRQRALLACASLLFLSAGCGSPLPESSTDYLRHAWETYKRIYITADGSVIDPDRGGGETTSEGQGYAMLRAAWMRDQHTFSVVSEWTQRHLARPDGLYSWRWTAAEGGKLLDTNTAADADQEIALALIIAAHAFDDPRLLERARHIVRAIRRHERIDVENGWFPAAGNWAVEERILNLSYFLPYAYPYFARIDPDGRWEAVTDTGYDLIVKTLQSPTTRLIPDFMVMTPKGEPAGLPQGTGLSGEFSSDAMRIYWRVAADCRLHKLPRACADPLGARISDGDDRAGWRVVHQVLDQRNAGRAN